MWDAGNKSTTSKAGSGSPSEHETSADTEDMLDGIAWAEAAG